MNGWTENRSIRQLSGEDWIIAAIVDGSIGYSDPAHAKILLKHYLEGSRQDWCERCLACYRGDLEKMLLADVDRFFYYETRPGGAEHNRRVITYVMLWEKGVAEHPDPLNAVGLGYPTMGL